MVITLVLSKTCDGFSAARIWRLDYALISY